MTTLDRRQLAIYSLAVLAAGDPSRCCATEMPFNPPFDPVTPLSTVGFADPPKGPKPVVSLDNRSRYASNDPSRSKVDPKRERDYERSVAPLREFSEQVVKLANRFTASGGRDLKSAGEAAALLKSWAKADALSRIESEPGELNRATVICASSLAYLQVGQALDPRDPDRRVLVEWLRNTGQSIMKAYAEGDRDRASRFNNHRYWAGLAVACAGLAAREEPMVAWGVDSAAAGLAQVGAQGALPLELARGPRALSYHAYSLGPLVMLTEIDARNGRRLPGAAIEALHRLVRFTLDGIDDPTAVSEAAGAPQEPMGDEGQPFEAHDVAWLEIYEGRFPGRSPWSARLPDLRPLGARALGGNLTLLRLGPEADRAQLRTSSALSLTDVNSQPCPLT